MASVQKFDRSMIEKALRGASLKYLRDSDGDFIVQFGHSDKMGCEVDILLLAAGSKAEIYSVTGRSNKRIPRSDWGRAMTICNTWNKEKRWPKAYLYMENPSTDTTAAIVLEHQIDLEHGIHQELLDDFTFTIVAGIFSFWEWAHEHQGL